MKRFAFRLESVLRWREAQTRLREAELQRQLGQRAAALSRIAEIREDRARSHREISSAPVSVAEMKMLDAYLKKSLEREQGEIAGLREIDLECEAARTAYTDARRNERLLRLLKEKALVNWNIEMLREVDAQAAEAYLASHHHGGA